MAYNEQLFIKIRESLSYFTEAHEKYMFGGVCFMVNDKMCLGVVKNEMMCRIHPDKMEEVLELPGCRQMDFTGKPMKGYVYVDNENLKTKKQIDYWIKLCLEFNPIANKSKKNVEEKIASSNLQKFQSHSRIDI